MIDPARQTRRRLALHGLELAAGAGAFFAAYLLRSSLAAWFPQVLQPFGRVIWLLPAFLLLWSGLTWMWDAYRDFRTRDVVSHAFGLLVTDLIAVLGVFSLVTVFRQHEVNRSLIGIYGVLHFATVLVLRLSLRGLLIHYAVRGHDRHFVLVGGTHDEAREAARQLSLSTGLVFQVKGFLTEEPSERGSTIDGIPVLGLFKDAPEIAKREVVDEIYLLPRRATFDEVRPVVLACDEMGIVTHLNLRLFEEVNARVETSEVGGRSFVTLTAVPKSGVQLAMKRGIDVVGALALLAVMSPVLGAVALLVKLTSRGPVIFRQERLGRNGRRFMLYKFRTMVADAEKLRAALEERNELTGPTFKIKSDPRVTWVGRILRKTSLDEFPQLLNVLKGDMSLVGPRPMLDHEVQKIRPSQRRRMNMRPGITSLWGVRGRNRIQFEEGVRYDLEYIDRWSLWLDVKILLWTIPAVITGRGAY